MDIETAFGKTLKKQRVEAKLSQEALAFECGVDRTFISLLERGLRQPTLKTLFKISSTLNVSPAQIILDVETLLKE